MAALAADVNASAVGNVSLIKLVAAATDIYYRGSVVYIDTAGTAQVTAAAGDRAVGISPKQQSVTAGDEVEVLVMGCIWLPVGTNVSAADEGDYLVNDGPTSTDNPADLVAMSDITVATNDAVVGTILRATASQMLVAISPGVTGRLIRTDTGTGDYSFV